MEESNAVQNGKLGQSPEANGNMQVAEKTLSLQQLKEILDLTIKEDDTNKVITFLVMLTNYTEDSQLNCAFVAPSSTGKSYIPLEISSLFPEEDLIRLSYCSPQAFFHDTGEYDEERNEITINLSRKILMFLDQPHTKLLERLRPLFSHDQKMLTSKITDKSETGGHRTKSVRIIGFPVVVFCTATQRIDEQEATRFMLLSPEMTGDKIRAAIRQKIKKESDRIEYERGLQADEARESLKRRIQDIKASGINSINILNTELLERRFLESNGRLKPRLQRDISKVMGLCKALALFNYRFRQRKGDTIMISDEDIENAIQLYREIAECQEHGLSPYVYGIFQKIILPLCSNADNVRLLENQKGVSRQEIRSRYFQIYGIAMPDHKLRQEIIPALEEAGLIIQVDDPNDKRWKLIRLALGNESRIDQNNSE